MATSSIRYHVTVVADSKDFEFDNLPGPEDQARALASARFQQENPGVTVESTIALSMNDWQAIKADAHQCFDREGSGCCEYCGGVIPGSFLDRKLNGSD